MRRLESPPEWLLLLLIVLGACTVAASSRQIEWRAASGERMYWTCPRCGPVELWRTADHGDGKGRVCSRCGSSLR